MSDPSFVIIKCKDVDLIMRKLKEHNISYSDTSHDEVSLYGYRNVPYDMEQIIEVAKEASEHKVEVRVTLEIGVMDADSWDYYFENGALCYNTYTVSESCQENQGFPNPFKKEIVA